MVAAITIVPNVDATLLKGTPKLLISVVRIDDQFIKKIAQSLLLPDLELTPRPVTTGGVVSEPFVSDDGVHAGYLSWTTRRAIEVDLRTAIEREELRLHYQPIVSCRTGAIVGAEALLRWRHPLRGDISPSVFIPIAEELGLVNTIGSMVLDRACHEAVSWPDHLMVAVNVSPVQMMGGRLATDIAQVLRRTGLAPHRLEIEITETALVADDELALRSLEEVRALGVKISLDDFGTGYSSLSYLHRFPIDRIKIDGSFVNKLPTDAGSASIVRAIAQLGASLNMQVTAEGIETDDQYSFVAEQGCGHMQGFLFNKPIDAKSAAKLFASGSSGRFAA